MNINWRKPRTLGALFAVLFVVGAGGFLIFFFGERYLVLNAKLKKAVQQESLLNQGLVDLDQKKKQLERDQLSFATRVADQEDRLKLLEGERKSLLEAIRRISDRNRELAQKEEAAEIARSELSHLERDYRGLKETAGELEKTKEDLEAKLKTVTLKWKKAAGSERQQYNRAARDIRKQYEGKIKTLQDDLEKLRLLSQQTVEISNERDRLKQELFHFKTAYYYNLGVVYTRYGLFRQAAEMYEQAIVINPDDAQSHHNLGILYELHLNRRKDAVQHYRRFLELEPDGKQQMKVRQWIEETEHGIGRARRTSMQSGRQAFERYFLPTS